MTYDAEIKPELPDLGIANVGVYQNSMRLTLGNYFSFDDFAPTFDIEDIACSLANKCRYSGHLWRNGLYAPKGSGIHGGPLFYSVAQHCVEVATLAKQRGHNAQVQLNCLLHDAAEAIVGDLIRPLKLYIRRFTNIFDKIEERVSEAIQSKFHCHFGDPLIKRFDMILLFAERRFLFPHDKTQWHGEKEVEHYDLNIRVNWGGSMPAVNEETRLRQFKCLLPHPAYESFINCYDDIKTGLRWGD